ncbi:P-loop containing NTP hydrolase pore-1-domain-containing protein [Dunaliella salina]|uniref:P-loop containing NTP hydrolase pore-1-domain-containing protein n=1 Tax=Dunaliella salina TaxID=3046 RepID=A0ABQ7GT88_DUNSA|nr:P-loop containing NTP hydrolase pore-1-domain-containing protein [Dunaliella salina]|eukprot:KAF5837835.1 P-loop containing NTP hydrolase pore-1-domain-containing protein [Dunaliella salina]
MAQEGDDGLAEQTTKTVFASYVCRSKPRLWGAHLHCGDVAEATSLSSVMLPVTDYPLLDSLPRSLMENGKLSQLQLEGILYACTKHLELLPTGKRAGFFLGDGAGIGKGRQIAGCIIDSYARGRKQHAWLSISSDLHLDAQRDLTDLGCYIKVINNVQTLDKETKALGLSSDFKEGVLFLTYSSLISKIKGKSRIDQIVQWLGGSSFEGLLVFDECHKAKNFTPGNEASSTKIATCVLELQSRLPMARVLYASATGVSEVGNMAYMDRMNLWGTGTAFQNFEQFLSQMKNQSISFLELLAMEMKAEGKYVARGLSFKDAEFSEIECTLTPQQVRMYDAAVAVWAKVKSSLQTVQVLTGKSSRDVMKTYWATVQRFFKLLCVSLKVPRVVAEAKEAIQKGYCVVVGLQTTGEAADASLGLEPGPVPGMVSTTKEMLVRFVAKHLHPEESDKGHEGEWPAMVWCCEPTHEKEVLVRFVAKYVRAEEADEGHEGEWIAMVCAKNLLTKRKKK